MAAEVDNLEGSREERGADGGTSAIGLFLFVLLIQKYLKLLVHGLKIFLLQSNQSDHSYHHVRQQLNRHVRCIIISLLYHLSR